MGKRKSRKYVKSLKSVKSRKSKKRSNKKKKSIRKYKFGKFFNIFRSKKKSPAMSTTLSSNLSNSKPTPSVFKSTRNNYSNGRTPLTGNYKIYIEQV